MSEGRKRKGRQVFNRPLLAEGITNMSQQYAVCKKKKKKKTHLKYNDTGKLLIKGWEKMRHANISQRKARVATLT